MAKVRGWGFAALVFGLTVTGSACSSGPCTDFAALADAVNAKALGCESFVASGARAFSVPEAVTACEPYADKYCTETDKTAVSDFRACVEGVADCSGDGKAFKDALDQCEEKLKPLTENCGKAISGIDL